MTRKQYRMLMLLNKKLEDCQRCSLFNNGRCLPSFTTCSEYVVIGEAPGENEVKQNTPFIGTAGKHLWTIMNNNGFSRDEFLIINTVNCRPVKGNRNGKPTFNQIERCSDWLRKYIRVMKPKAMITLGNYAMSAVINEVSGIMSLNGKVVESKKYDTSIVLSVHPSVCIYSGAQGQEMLDFSVKRLKEIGK